MWQTATTGRFITNDAAATWAMPHLPEPMTECWPIRPRRIVAEPRTIGRTGGQIRGKRQVTHTNR
ncbi:DUF4111 domain-containing protein [Bradyrhizobium sp. 186]|nr:DUF4111 domain-containing protein [Bradyrhizobium sp. 186]